MGYNLAYSLVIFLNCLLFSTMVPTIPIFAALYFYIKYLVDKYKLIFVYFKKYDSGGRIREGAQRLLLINLLFYMFIMASFFSLKFHDYGFFPWLSVTLMVIWLGLYIYGSRRLSERWNKRAQSNTQTQLKDPESESGRLLENDSPPDQWKDKIDGEGIQKTEKI